MCVLLFSLLTFAGASATVAPETSRDREEALQWAFRFASTIAIEPHIVDRSRTQYEILERFLKYGFVEDVKERVHRVGNWRKALIFTDVAEYWARKGESAKALHWLKKARKARDRIEGFQASWQKERVVGRVSLVEELLAERGHPVKRDESGPSLAARLERLSKVEAPGAYDANMEELQVVAQSKHWEVQQAAAETYIRILRNLGDRATSQQVAEIREAVSRLCKKLPGLVGFRMRCALCRAVFESGQKDVARDVLNEVADYFEGRDLNPRFDVASLVRFADICGGAAGQPARAESALQRAAEALKNNELQRMDHIDATIALAGGYATFGKREVARLHFHKALQLAAGQINPRPRAMAFARICTEIADSGYAIPDDMRMLLEQELTKLRTG